MKYNLLTIHETVRRDEYRSLYVRCVCDCGNEKVIRKKNVTSGRTKSCGCLLPRQGVLLKDMIPEYAKYAATWANMNYRCYRPSTRSYQWYGARGITVCDRWRFGESGMSGFECFFADMGPRPEGMTLDRIDNNGHYTPDNCKWTSAEDQQMNRRSTKLSMQDREDICASEDTAEQLSVRYGVTRQHISLVKRWGRAGGGKTFHK